MANADLTDKQAPMEIRESLDPLVPKALRANPVNMVPMDQKVKMVTMAKSVALVQKVPTVPLALLALPETRVQMVIMVTLVPTVKLVLKVLMVLMVLLVPTERLVQTEKLALKDLTVQTAPQAQRDPMVFQVSEVSQVLMVNPVMLEMLVLLVVPVPKVLLSRGPPDTKVLPVLRVLRELLVARLLVFPVPRVKKVTLDLQDLLTQDNSLRVLPDLLVMANQVLLVLLVLMATLWLVLKFIKTLVPISMPDSIAQVLRKVLLGLPTLLILRHLVPLEQPAWVVVEIVYRVDGTTVTGFLLVPTWMHNTHRTLMYRDGKEIVVLAQFECMRSVAPLVILPLLLAMAMEQVKNSPFSPATGMRKVKKGRKRNDKENNEDVKRANIFLGAVNVPTYGQYL